MELIVKPLGSHTEWSTSSKPSRWIRKQNTQEYIVIHQTGCMDVNAETMWRSYNNNPVPRSAGAHIFIDHKEAYEMVDLKYVTWNCGDGNKPNRKITNYNSIALELCIFNDNAKYLKTLDNAAQLIANIMFKYGIDLDHVVTHMDASGKSCPDQLLRGVHGVTLQDFYKMIQGAYMLNVIKDVPIRINGDIYKVQGLNVNGNNYIKLQDLNKAGIQVTYSEGYPTITTTK